MRWFRGKKLTSQAGHAVTSWRLLRWVVAAAPGITCGGNRTGTAVPTSSAGLVFVVTASITRNHGSIHSSSSTRGDAGTQRPPRTSSVKYLAASVRAASVGAWPVQSSLLRTGAADRAGSYDFAAAQRAGRGPRLVSFIRLLSDRHSPAATAITDYTL